MSETTETKKKFSIKEAAEKIGTFLGRIVGHIDNFVEKTKGKCVRGVLGEKPGAFRRVLARFAGLVFDNAKLIAVAILITAAIILVATLIPKIVALTVVLAVSGLMFACWVLFGKITEEVPA